MDSIKSNAKIITIIIGLFALLGLWFVFNSLQPENRREATLDFSPEEPQAEMQENPQELENNPERMIEEAKGNPASLVADLEDSAGGINFGKAYILRDQKPALVHYVEANLPELIPESETFYEGWLVDPGTQEFISTGKMQQNEAGLFTLLFTSEELMESYSRVVITIEEIDDQTPETHILEGELN